MGTSRFGFSSSFELLRLVWCKLGCDSLDLPPKTIPPGSSGVGNGWKAQGRGRNICLGKKKDFNKSSFIGRSQTLALLRQSKKHFSPPSMEFDQILGINQGKFDLEGTDPGKEVDKPGRCFPHAPHRPHLFSHCPWVRIGIPIPRNQIFQPAPPAFPLLMLQSIRFKEQI